MAFDIIEFIEQDPGAVINNIVSISGVVVNALFLKKMTGIKAATSEFEKEKVRVINNVAEEMLEAGAMSYYEYSKTKNYMEIAKKADQYRKKVNIAKQNFDWHIRFFEECGTINDEGLKDLWAKLLAYEVDDPGSCSFRTLNTLKNLTPQEAFLFQRVCNCAIRIGDEVSIIRSGNYLESKGITYEDILKLDDCGLIRNDALFQESRFRNSKCFIEIGNDKILLIKSKDESPQSRIQIPQYLFTSSGRELFSIVAREADIQEIVDCLKGQFPRYEIMYGGVQSKEPNKIIYAVGNEKYVKVTIN